MEFLWWQWKPIGLVQQSPLLDCLVKKLISSPVQSSLACGWLEAALTSAWTAILEAHIPTCSLDLTAHHFVPSDISNNTIRTTNPPFKINLTAAENPQSLHQIHDHRPPHHPAHQETVPATQLASPSTSTPSMPRTLFFNRRTGYIFNDNYIIPHNVSHRSS